MGIKDLLKNLEEATVQKNIGDFAGKRLAIDASGWLHKAVYTTAEDWIESNCGDSQLYVDVIITRLKQLQGLNITPVMVFDGKRNTLKSETNAKREEGRIGNMENARRLLESIHKTVDKGCKEKMRLECIACLQRGLGATHEMEKNLLAALRKYGIDTVVAPYEADPQLAYLCHIGYCHGVLSEDSDILVYSAVSGTPFPVLCKYEARTGGVQITDLQLCGILGTAPSSAAANDGRSIKIAVESLEDVCFNVGVAAGASNKRKSGAEAKPPPQSFVTQLQTQFKSSASSQLTAAQREANVAGRRMFVQLCLLAGCDYSDSIPGVGLLTALQAIIRFRDVDNNARLKRVCDYFKLSGKKVADNYLQRLLRAEQLFYYHPVYNPYTDSIAHFTDPTADTAALGVSVCPEITEAELLRLGGDHSEILTLARKDSSDSRNAHAASSGLTIHDVCRGHFSIKDHAEIVPRYPWERFQQGRMVATEASGRCTGWYMRRTLMSSISQSSTHSLYSSSAGASSSAASKTDANTGRSLISTFMLPRTAPRPAAVSSAVDATSGAGRAVTSSYFSSSTSVRSSHFTASTAEKTRSPPAARTVAHRFSAFDLLTAPTSAHSVSVESKGTVSTTYTDTTEVILMETEQSVYDLEDDDAAEDHNELSTFPKTQSSSSSGEGHTTQESGRTASQPQHLHGSAESVGAESGMFDTSAGAAPTVYDVMDSPLVVRRPVGNTLRADNEVPDGTAAGSMLVDLSAESPVAKPSHIVTPTLSRVGQNPFKTAPPVQPTATVKKPRQPVATSSEHASGSIHQAFSVSAQVHRKTLGAASFVPIQPPPLDESIAAARRASTVPVGNETGVKRKNGTFAPVQVPRKKLPNVQSSGTIMVASIKSFFSAV